jgi:hypothetical protein
MYNIFKITDKFEVPASQLSKPKVNQLTLMLTGTNITPTKVGGRHLFINFLQILYIA